MVAKKESAMGWKPSKRTIVVGAAAAAVVALAAAIVIPQMTAGPEFVPQYAEPTFAPKIGAGQAVPAPIGSAEDRAAGVGEPSDEPSASTEANGGADAQTPEGGGSDASGGTAGGKADKPTAGKVDTSHDAVDIVDGVEMIDITAELAEGFSFDMVDVRSQTQGFQKPAPEVVVDDCLLDWAKHNIVRLSDTGFYDIVTACDRPTAVLMGPAPAADSKVLVYGAKYDNAPEGMRELIGESTSDRMAFVAVRSADGKAQLLATAELPPKG